MPTLAELADQYRTDREVCTVSRPQCVDAVLLFNELDLLLVRINELWPVVDRFVICESTHTFSGKPKPLHFAETIEAFSPYLEKIKHVVYTPPLHDMRSWDREFGQRNSFLSAVEDLPDDTWVLLSDIDELPRATHVRRVRDVGMLSCDPRIANIAVFQLRNFYYYVNCRGVTEPWWTGLKMATLGTLRPDPQKLVRELPCTDGQCVQVNDSGWHLSYIGGAEQVRRKIQAFSHTEYDLPVFTDAERVQERIAKLQDPFDRDLRWEKVPFDDSYPIYLRENRDRFSDWILP